MSRKSLAIVFALSALILFPASFVLVYVGADMEPFFDYEARDAFTQVGLSTAAIALWLVWSLGVFGLVAASVFKPRWLFGLLLSATCIFYLMDCPAGYLYDLENFMLAPQQQKRIGVPVRTEYPAEPEQPAHL